MLAIMLAILSIPFTLRDSAEEHVGLIELNHFYDQRGSLVYDQVIFYERAPENGRFQVRAWCLVEDREQLNRRPIKNETTGLYQVDYYDKDNRLTRKLTSRLYRETWSQVDPERNNKKRHDERLRIALVKRIPLEPVPEPTPTIPESLQCHQ